MPIPNQAWIANLIGEEVGEGIQTRLRIAGNSMFPIFRSGDIAFVERKSSQDCNQGDVIVSRIQDGFLMHRLIEKNDARLILQGDNCILTDPPIVPNSIFGEVVSVKRNNKQTYSKSKYWIMVNKGIGWLCYQKYRFTKYCERMELKVSKRKSEAMTSIVRKLFYIIFQIKMRIIFH